jgi:hypothetical protein
VQDGAIITYLHLDPRQDFLPRKRMVFLTVADKEVILQDAYARRQRSAASLDVRESSKIFR